MALAWKVTESKSRAPTLGYQKGATLDEMNTSATIAFDVEAYDDAGGTIDPTTVTEREAAARPEVPKVNLTNYYRPGAGKLIPFLLCSGKRVQRDPQKGTLFRVDCSYASTEPRESEEQDPPTNLADFTPREVATLNEDERVLYQDRGGGDYILPTGNMYPSPLVQRKPTLRLAITQYETALTYQQALDRKLKTNNTTYRGKAENTWLIQQVEFAEIVVQLAAGPFTAVEVTYTLDLKETGWLHQPARADTHHLTVGNDKSTLAPNVSADGVTGVTRFLDTDGTLLTPQPATPPNDDYFIFDGIDFSTFLQV